MKARRSSAANIAAYSAHRRVRTSNGSMLPLRRKLPYDFLVNAALVHRGSVIRLCGSGCWFIGHRLSPKVAKYGNGAA